MDRGAWCEIERDGPRLSEIQFLRSCQESNPGFQGKKMTKLPKFSPLEHPCTQHTVTTRRAPDRRWDSAWEAQSVHNPSALMRPPYAPSPADVPREATSCDGSLWHVHVLQRTSDLGWVLPTHSMASHSVPLGSTSTSTSASASTSTINRRWLSPHREILTAQRHERSTAPTPDRHKVCSGASVLADEKFVTTGRVRENNATQLCADCRGKEVKGPQARYVSGPPLSYRGGGIDEGVLVEGPSWGGFGTPP